MVTVMELREHFKRIKVKAPSEDGVDNRVKEVSTEFLTERILIHAFK